MPVIVPAYAKLNLTLDLLGLRQDGYHEIASVMQTVSLHDLLLVERSDCRIFECEGMSIGGGEPVLRPARELGGRPRPARPLRVRPRQQTSVGAGRGRGGGGAAPLPPRAPP